MAEIHVKSINDIVSKVDEDIDSKKIKNTVVQVIRFLIDKYEFALDVLDVKEIKEIEKIRHLPNSLPFIIGLLNLRGDIIPIFDLTKKLELENISVEKLASIGEKSGKLEAFENEKVEFVESSNKSNINDKVEEFNIESFSNEKDSLDVNSYISTSDTDQHMKKESDQDDRTNIEPQIFEDFSDTRSIIVCKVENELFGILVDRIIKVQYLSSDEYEKSPQLFDFIGNNFVKGFAKIEGKIIVVLALKNLFY